jgi:predicted acetyltransferase
MTQLRIPDVSLHRSWAEAVAEFGEEVMHGSGLWDFDNLDTTEDGCAAVVAHLIGQGDPATELPEGRVHSNYYWITDDGEFVGYLALRHSLTQWLLDEGGHIGFSVRPSRRREGHARRALGLALTEAKELGIDRVLLTCDEDNDGSRLTIEGNGGVYEDTRKGKRRYWIAVG